MYVPSMNQQVSVHHDVHVDCMYSKYNTNYWWANYVHVSYSHTFHYFPSPHVHVYVDHAANSTNT